MPKTCTFELNKNDATYFSGEIISGAIILTTTSDEEVRDVSILFTGEGKVKWSESTKRNGKSTTEHYTSEETYIDSQTIVRDEGVLPSGTHTYTFNISLPLECTSSCDFGEGSIRYELVLKINRFYRFDKLFKKPLTVIKTIDLNLNPSYTVPVLLDVFSEPSCWSCTDGKIFYELTIPFGAYVPGQILNYNLEISNQSMDDVDGYRIEFKQKVTLTAKYPHTKKKIKKNTLVTKYFSEKCLRLTNRIMEGEFCIPETVSSTEISDIIYIEYYLKVIVEISGCCSNTDLKVPIIIGTIPIRESLPTNSNMPSAPPQQILPSAPELQSPDCDELKSPPTYEEASQSTKPSTDIQPQYPTYNALDSGKY